MEFKTLGQKNRKNLEFKKFKKNWKNLEFLTTLTISEVKFQIDTKNLSLK